jgi:hypothetical protein
MNASVQKLLKQTLLPKRLSKNAVNELTNKKLRFSTMLKALKYTKT